MAVFELNVYVYRTCRLLVDSLSCLLSYIGIGCQSLGLICGLYFLVDALL